MTEGSRLLEVTELFPGKFDKGVGVTEEKAVRVVVGICLMTIVRFL